MKRWHLFAAGMIAALGTVFVSGAARSRDDEKPAEDKPAKSPVVIGQKTAVFNMAAVMRDFHQAKYQVWVLNKKKDEMSKNLVALRSDYVKTQNELRQRPDHPGKDTMSKHMLTLARQIEDEDRTVSKQLNDDASAVIGDLYDKMHAAVSGVAQQNGFQIVLAYPDAVTRDEKGNPHIKELKLKPPAAQPFYVTPEVDITAAVVKALNDKYPPIDPDTKQPVDVSKLPVPVAPQPAPIPLPMPMGGLLPPAPMER